MEPIELVEALSSVSASLEAEIKRLQNRLTLIADQEETSAMLIRADQTRQEIARAEDQLLDATDFLEATKRLLPLPPDKGGAKPTSLLELVTLLDSKEGREREGRWMELMRQGGEAIKEEWSGLCEFPNGEVDRVILSADSVRGEDNGE